jgi:hypothetical protein
MQGTYQKQGSLIRCDDGGCKKVGEFTHERAQTGYVFCPKEFYDIAHKRLESPGTWYDLEKVISFRERMSKLWSDHVIWTREFILLIFRGGGDNSDIDFASARLLKNQLDIGNHFGPYYGKNIRKKIIELLSIHIQITGDIVIGIKKESPDSIILELLLSWYKNGRDISKTLSDINPEKWEYAAVWGLIKTHLDDTTMEIKYIASDQYNDSITTFDKIKEHILKLADVLSAGLIGHKKEQFLVK